MRNALLAAGIAILSLATGTAHAYTATMENFCKATIADLGGQMPDDAICALVVTTYFGGIAAGFEKANRALSIKGQPKLFCIPEKLRLDGEMVRDFMRGFEKRHPEIGKYDEPTGAFFALQDAFPCKPQ
jgi:hypothetical protein